MTALFKQPVGIIGSQTGLVVRAVGPAAIVVCVLVLATLSLLLTAPTDGDFWWNDAPRHAMDGVFVKDLVAAHPVHDPVQWAIDYYLKRPALAIMFYPPLFAGAEAIAFALFGVSQFVAQSTVSLFILLLASSTYTLSRMLLPRWSAVGAALLVIGSPETAFWGRQVMLDVPAYALIVTSGCCLAMYLKGGRPLLIYLTTLFLLAAIYTKYNAGVLAPALAMTFVVVKGKGAFRDRHAILAGALALLGLLPAFFAQLKFGAVNRDSVSGLTDTLPLNTLECWLYYIKLLPSQLGLIPVLLGIGGLALMVKRSVRSRDRWVYGLLLAWIAVGYLCFTLISVKEPRHSIMALLPLAVAAPLFVHAILPKSLGEGAGLLLGVVTLAYTLLFCPVSRIEGYQDIATYLEDNVPPGGIVLYSGFRDANLIFDLATSRGRSDITVVRADKLLVTTKAGERRRGVKQADDSEATIAQMLRDLGASYFVIQPGFWGDLAVMDRFDKVISGPDYRKTGHFALSGNLSTQDGIQGIDIFRPTYEVSAKPHGISIDMPLASQRFEGTIGR